ncbi:MAG: tRNA preQ1(34) S-adenosylmethionine ribosyltransferase-isomerase QueA [Proteobacteria bacterium]|nr:tRNA preQ1(34) S-adenosylmethionine ribosyltransferase-isomerase QueA [Pseudomonadota bacterium]
MRVDDFDFILPPERIATLPANPRTAAKMLRVTLQGFSDFHISDFPNELQKGDALILNNTCVIPARLNGMVDGKSVEITLHKRVDGASWWAFAKPAKKLPLHAMVSFAPDFSADVRDKAMGGEVLLRFNASDAALDAMLDRHGRMPLPPYIAKKRTPDKSDNAHYQTVFAKEKGAVAAPTAGLHFTDTLLEQIRARGVEIVFVTLHVGAGTFLPVKVDEVKDHVMHAEQFHMSQQTADTLNHVRKAGGKLVAVGTTALRTLETVADKDGFFKAASGDTKIFITPGYSFKSADRLLTNFHLPRSTLFMLVSAFSGLDRMKKAYQHAIEHDYRFYSYGDATLLDRITA